MTVYLQAFLCGVALAAYGGMFVQFARCVWNRDWHGAALVAGMFWLLEHVHFEMRQW